MIWTLKKRLVNRWLQQKLPYRFSISLCFLRLAPLGTWLNAAENSSTLKPPKPTPIQSEGVGRKLHFSTFHSSTLLSLPPTHTHTHSQSTNGSDQTQIKRWKMEKTDGSEGWRIREVGEEFKERKVAEVAAGYLHSPPSTPHCPYGGLTLEVVFRRFTYGWQQKVVAIMGRHWMTPFKRHRWTRSTQEPEIMP